MNNKLAIRKTIASKINVLLLLAATALSVPAHADTMRDLIHTALKDGSAAGVIDDPAAKLFAAATGSQDDIHVTIKKIKDYDSGCGRLRIEMKQSGIKDSKGNLTTGAPAFEISICPDGRAPHEVKDEAEARNRAELKTCVATIERGAVDKDTGAMRAVIAAQGCPKGGQSHWRYTGSCSASAMPDGVYDTFPINDKGAINIKLLVPAQCLKAQNSWQAVILDAHAQVIGDISATWQ